MKVGYAGLGNIGGQLASRLRRQHALTVYDGSDASVQHLVDQGTTACSSASELPAQCRVIMLWLPTPDQVRSAIFGEDGIAAAAKPGTLIVGQTTGDSGSHLNSGTLPLGEMCASAWHAEAAGGYA
jgi:3-hydroxyisobutyrate dehydrogenase